MSILIQWPWLALLPAVLFAVAFARVRRPVVLATAILWALYAGYELGMKQRWLCSGECNIRVDLLLLYPLLAVLSLISGIVALRAALRRPGT